MLPRTPTKPRRAPTAKTTRPTGFAPIRAARRTSIPPNATQAIDVTTSAEGRCIIVPATNLYAQKLLRLTNGETLVRRNVPFRVQVHNAGTRLQVLPKGMKVGTAVPNPVGCLQVAQEAPDPQDRPPDDATRRNVTTPPDPRETDEIASATPSWEELLRATLRDERVDDDLHAEIIEMLRKHERMWSGTLGAIHATEHRIELVPGATPVNQPPYRAGHASDARESREIIRTQVEKMLRAGVIEPATVAGRKSARAANHPTGVPSLGRGSGRADEPYRYPAGSLVREKVSLPGGGCVTKGCSRERRINGAR